MTVPVGAKIMINRSPYTVKEVFGEPRPTHTVVGYREMDGYLRIRPINSPADPAEVANGRFDTFISETEVRTFD